MKDIKRIAQSIDRVLTIEEQREENYAETEILNPYLFKSSLHQNVKDRIPVE